MDNISFSNSAKKIDEMYSNLSYFDQYGGSVFMFVILLIILFLVLSYATVMRKVQPIKDDWTNQRCKPQVIPFAGLINKPKDESIVDFTGKNFNYCMQNILIGITGKAVQPITYLTYMVQNLFNAIAKCIQFIRIIISKIRDSITSIAKEVLGRVANIMVPIQQIVISFKDMINKVNGILTAGLYTSLGAYYTLKALLGTIVQFIVTILVMLAALIVSMWIIPFTWPVAISSTVIFISISIPLLIIIVFMTQVLHIKTSFSLPKAPSKPPLSSCFDKNTLLKMHDGSEKCIADIKVGDKLIDNNLVTDRMILDTNGEIMYNIGGVIVSGTHKIKHKWEWISVCEHPERKRIDDYNEPFLYCLNTSSKKIEVNGEIYMDWDELYDDDIDYLLKDMLNFANYTDADLIKLHENFDNGFTSKTKIKLNNGTSKNIQDVKVGDILDKNIKVMGVVEINGKTLKNRKNLILGDKELNLEKRKINLNNEDVLYHLITKEKYFYIENRKEYHYDSNIEMLLERYRKNYYL
uniref:Vint domain-containing protein n=1 Tax=viral metagenome TaxID=1070528 RepID=A0A6C0DBQ8_9ZZZZ